MLTCLYGVADLTTLVSADQSRYPPGELQDVETDLHSAFYAWIKRDPTYREAYQRLIRDVYTQFFPEDPVLFYQSFPSIRFQFPGNKSVPKHCDSDEIGRHPIGERNFLLPLTPMTGTTRLFLESHPGSGVFEGIDLAPGELLVFNGNTCVHYNEVNTESFVRVSFDFRCLRLTDYLRMDSIASTNPRNTARTPVKMLLGGYYQCMWSNGATPWLVMPPSILQTRPVFDESEAEAVSAYFRTGDPFLTEFAKTTEFEAALAQRVGVRHCITTPSGTSALLLALLALKVGVGDEVIVPDYTMVATMNVVKVLGATPILVDVDSETYTVSPNAVRAARTPRTKAVIHVSLNNRSTGLLDLVEYCKETELPLLEDAAQSLGCTYEGRAYGTFGCMGCFSLSSPKIITTGQGGFVVTNNDALAWTLRCMKNFGRKSGGEEQYIMFGLNFKVTDLQSVVGLAQLAKLDERIVFLRRLYDRYASHLSSCQHIKLLPPGPPGWIPWFVDIQCEERDRLKDFLAKHGVQTRVTYPVLHTSPGNYPNASRIASTGLFLPTHLRLTDAEVDYISLLLLIFDADCRQKVVTCNRLDGESVPA
jgi:perosamine synthetase